jgi:hypothetical protein
LHSRHRKRLNWQKARRSADSAQIENHRSVRARECRTVNRRGRLIARQIKEAGKNWISVPAALNNMFDDPRVDVVTAGTT